MSCLKPAALSPPSLTHNTTRISHSQTTIAALLTTVVTVLAMSLGEPKIKVGDKFPTDVIVHQGFAGNTPDAPKTTGTLLSGKKCLVVTLPGAFTPT